MSGTIEYVRTHRIEGVLRVVTGLHVGAGRDAIEIGGLDSPVLKHPHTQFPYIPGSSLKGKLRSLLEWALGRVDPKGGVWNGNSRLEADDPILRIFGTTQAEWTAGPSRVIVRDAHLVKEWLEDKLSKGLPLTEEKTEVRIDRIQGKAADGTLRTMERVPAEAEFRLEILFKEYSVDGDGGACDRRCLNRLMEGLKLLEKDCLGGSGSRGYGQVRVLGLTLDDGQNKRDIQEAFDRIGPILKERPQEVLF